MTDSIPILNEQREVIGRGTVEIDATGALVRASISDAEALAAITAIRDSAHDAIDKIEALQPYKRQQLAGPRIPQPSASKRRRQAVRAARRANR